MRPDIEPMGGSPASGRQGLSIFPTSRIGGQVKLCKNTKSRPVKSGQCEVSGGRIGHFGVLFRSMMSSKLFGEKVSDYEMTCIVTISQQNVAETSFKKCI